MRGRRKIYGESSKRRTEREEKKKTWNKKTKRVLCEEFYEEIWKCILRKIKSDLPGGGALRAIYKKCSAMILSK